MVAAPPAHARGQKSRCQCDECRFNRGLRLREGNRRVYHRVCDRLGLQPSGEVNEQLSQLGAVVVDVPHCPSRFFEATCLFLREAPAGVREVVVCAGKAGGWDSCQKCGRHGTPSRGASRHGAFPKPTVATSHQRMRDMMALEHSRLFGLCSALLAFTSIRSSTFRVLDFHEVALGPCAGQPPGAVATLSSCLDMAKGLQRLTMRGCRLDDAAFELLLPRLSTGLQRLQELDLAQNALHDHRMLSKFLTTRASMQQKLRVPPLAVLDLSCNPALGAVRLKPKASAHRCVAEAMQKPRYSREALIRVVSDAFKGGLQLEVLLLQSMELSRNDIKPLLQLLKTEVKTLQITREQPSVSLRSVRLEDNPLEADFTDVIEQALLWLSVADSEQVAKPGAAAPAARTAARMERAMSLPLLDYDESDDDYGPLRSALSEGDVPSGDEEDADSYAQSDLEHREAKKSEFVHDLEVLRRKLTHQPRSSRSLPGMAGREAVDDSYTSEEESSGESVSAGLSRLSPRTPGIPCVRW
mmetsp:Transcript_54574/g.127619  ORF Transcript_54574/g.127619 Transcript_54574/m.127619 type:complete len:526 (-) Transcript_54574:5-1582(-)